MKGNSAGVGLESIRRVQLHIKRPRNFCLNNNAAVARVCVTRNVCACVCVPAGVRARVWVRSRVLLFLDNNAAIAVTAVAAAAAAAASLSAAARRRRRDLLCLRLRCRLRRRCYRFCRLPHSNLRLAERSLCAVKNAFGPPWR